MRINKDLTNLTQGEMLWVWRKECDYTGHEAAAFLEIGRGAYWEAEQDNRKLPAHLYKYASIVRASEKTLLQLARRRSGWSLQETCRRVKVTHPTLLARERAGDQKLRKWWEKRGFSFSPR